MSSKEIARKLRRDQTKEEKELWRVLRGRQFAGFKFRRQYVAVGYILDFYCADAKLAVELDGFHHGSPEEIQNDERRSKTLAEQGIEVLRFWNHQWQKIVTGACWKFGFGATANRCSSQHGQRRRTKIHTARPKAYPVKRDN